MQPCGHTCVCTTCAKDLLLCPTCCDVISGSKRANPKPLSTIVGLGNAFNASVQPVVRRTIRLPTTKRAKIVTQGCSGMEIHGFKEPDFDFDSESNSEDDLAILETPTGSLQNRPRRASCGSGNSVLLGLNDTYTDTSDDDEERGCPSDSKPIQDTNNIGKCSQDGLDNNPSALDSKEVITNSLLDGHGFPACTSVDIQSESMQIVQSHDNIPHVKRKNPTMPGNFAKRVTRTEGPAEDPSAFLTKHGGQKPVTNKEVMKLLANSPSKSASLRHDNRSRRTVRGK